MEVEELHKGSNGYQVDVIIHAENRDYMLLEKAKELHIMKFTDTKSPKTSFGLKDDLSRFFRSAASLPCSLSISIWYSH